MRRYLVFALAQTRFAVAVESLIEIGTVPDVAPVPNVPQWLSGLVHLRGDVLAVIDLRIFLGLTPRFSPKSRLLVARGESGEAVAGLVVDEVLGAVRLYGEDLRPPPDEFKTGLDAFLIGVVESEGDLLAVLNLEKLTTSPEIRCFEAI